MKLLKLFLFTLLPVTLFFSCQKEYSLENPTSPTGSWQFNDSTKLYTGDIDSAFIETTATTKILHLMGPSASGTQTFNLELYATDSFTLGSYKASLSQAEFEYYTSAKTIYQANQLNGEFIVTITTLANNKIAGTFSGIVQDSSGNFKTLTLGQFTSTIKLTGSGSSGTGTAVGTLGASAGVCTSSTSSGVYTQGVVLTSANTVQLTVNITTAGTYTIATNTVNGVTFAATGTFTTTGVQNVILTGSGTPTASGSQTFTVTFGSSTCTFAITFAAGTAPVADYFPTTVNLNWTYGLQGGTASDSLFDKVINYSPPNSLGNTYSTITEESFPVIGIPDDSAYYRKPGGDYYEYIRNVTDYFGFDSGTVSSPASGEYIFLKDNVATGTTWQSPSYSGTATISGVPTNITVFINMTLLAKSVTATSGNVTSTDVIKVKYDYTIASGNIIFVTEERWFAKGIGLIYDSFSSGGTTDIYTIGQYH